jgi:hypothetical protein
MPSSFSIPKGVTKTINLLPIDSSVPPQPGAILPSPIPSWFVSDPTVVNVVPAADGLSAQVTMLKASASTTVNNSLQNSNNVNILGSFTLTSPQDPATAIDYSISA